MKKLSNFFYRIWYFRKIQKFNRINRRLDKANRNKEVDRIILKGRINKHIRKFLKVDADSKYIPFDFKSREKVRKEIYLKFGEEMERLNVKVTKSLILR